MRIWKTFSLTILMILLAVSMGCFSEDDSSDDDNFGPDSDDDDDNDDNNDDNDDDNDTASDDDDDDDDDDTYPDTYVAPWPQSNIQPKDYDSTPAAGPMRLKAGDYDQWHLDWHQPFYGSTVGTVFADPARTTLSHYHDYGDSTIWSGTYLASQVFRHYVTGDQQALTNVLRTAASLSRHLHITGRTGFIARYAAPQDPLIYPGDTNCDASDRCHRIETGEYAGDFWHGETSRDQYTGWFFGMAMAYDLIDDVDLREQIVADVTEVLDELIANGWVIIDEAGERTDAAPQILPPMQLTWALIGYHMTGLDRFKTEVQHWLKDSTRTYYKLMHISFMNHYTQYYGNNLSHTNYYNLLRLGEAYFSPEDFEFQLSVFENQVHTFTRLSHNAWFNTIFMGHGDYTPTKNDPYQDQLEQDLGEFRDAPNDRYYVDPTDGILDPLSVLLSDLMDDYPWLEEIMGDVDPQSEEAHPVLEQCTTDFLWQRNPFRIEPCGSDTPEVVNAGVDYLVAYWMASYYKFIQKDD